MYRADDIAFEASGRTLLGGASVAVVPGRVHVLVGPNGAGKSTLLKILAGELRPHKGRVTLAGGDIAGLAPARLARMRAVLPQSTHVAFPFTVAEIVAIGAPDGRHRQAQVRRALQRVELTDFVESAYDRLSGGEKQRVHLARVLVQLENGEGPGYLLLDEPTASLDIAQQLLVVKIMRGLAADGVGLFAVLHDLNLAAMAADDITALKDGRVAAYGAPAEVITDARIAELYGVAARIGWAPSTPFLLPQSVMG